MTSTIADTANAVLAQLETRFVILAEGPDDLAILERVTGAVLKKFAEHRQDAIRHSQAFLEERAHPVAFIGSVGVGKSSLISVLADLLVGPPPSSRASLKDSSVLSIGSGRTTLCEVRIQEANDDVVGLALDPFSPEEMKREIELFAQDEWARKHPEPKRPAEDDSDPTSPELHRAIRGMTGYSDRQETYVDGGVRRRRYVRPLDEVIPKFDSAAALGEHLVARGALPSRTRTTWQWKTRSQESLKELKSLLEAIQRGTEPTAALPRRITVTVPRPLAASTSGLDLTLIDTQGLDGNIESRGDILDILRDPRAVVVLCGSFKDAPDDTIRSALRSMMADPELLRALPRTLVVLVDHGDADQVNGADGDREFGQQLKIDECHVVLEDAGLSRLLQKDQIVAFDALKDSRHRLTVAIDGCLSRLRGAVEDELSSLVWEARQFLDGADDPRIPDLRERVDHGIKEALAAHPLTDAPMRDPLEGAYSLIRDSLPSVVYAACRRNGVYFNLDIYAAIELAAARAATSWLWDLMGAVMEKLDELARDPALAPVDDHIHLRRRQFAEGRSKLAADYAHRVQEQVRGILQADPVWQACSNEWGTGPGYKERVLGQLAIWSRRQQGLTAHEHVDAEAFLPLIGEATRPLQAPRFTIQVKNLRALRQVSWKPDQVCALIGANGTGKTTLLEALRFLHLAYERGLSEAVNIVFHGGSNLKSWGAPEEEPIELGVDLGDASWRIQLITREGSVANLTNETLVDRGREIFSRDSLGNFLHGRERIEGGPHIGLRTLMDRGAHEPAIRRMASFLQAIHVYRDPDLVSLREGSKTTDDRSLHSRGTNAVTILRRWFQERSHRHRYQFVLEGLDAAFPNKVRDMDFREAGNTLVANLYRPGIEASSPLSDEANGVLQLLVLLCQVAAVEDESVVAIDEPENGLHPYALRAFLRRTSRWARQHNLTVLLATHSTVLLDEMSSQPEQVYVMKAKEPGGPVPTRLDELFNRTWLEEYRLGDLYERGEIGSNEDVG